MGVRSHRSMQYGAGATAGSTARMTYPRGEPQAVISSAQDAPMAFSWLDAVYVLNEFAGIIGMSSQINRLVTFGQGTLTWDQGAQPFEPSTCGT